MLKLDIPEIELYDETKQEFVTIAPFSLSLEHSLVSISKWESKWHKAFLENNNKTTEELKDYVRCMTLTQNVKPEFYDYVPNDIIDKINTYIDDPMTATTINSGQNKGPGRQIITSELIYYWMIQLGIPFECQKWHINRLLILIQVCSIKNDPKKMSKRDIYSQNRSLNAARRAAMKSRG